MNLAELTQFINKLSGLDEMTFTLLIVCVFFARFFIKKLTGKGNPQSSLQLQGDAGNIKFKGPATIATLIVLLNFFRSRK